MATDPTVPSGYIGGSLTLSAGVSAYLLALIQAQLDPHCPGAAMEVNLFSDSTNSSSDTVKVGSVQVTDGADVDDTHFGYALSPGGSRNYRTSYPGASSPVARLKVYCKSSAKLHVEIIP